jgi:hypothetical protein
MPWPPPPPPGKKLPVPHWIGGWVGPEPVWTLWGRNKTQYIIRLNHCSLLHDCLDKFCKHVNAKLKHIDMFWVFTKGINASGSWIVSPSILRHFVTVRKVRIFTYCFCFSPQHQEVSSHRRWGSFRQWVEALFCFSKRSHHTKLWCLVAPGFKMLAASA